MTRSPGKKLLKIAGISLGILLVLLMGFHFWFKAHARRMLEDLVESKSNGSLKLKIEKFSFNYFQKKMQLENAVLYNTDTSTGPTAYHFSIHNMQMQVKAILPIIFNNQFMIDSLTLMSPRIEVTRLREAEKPDSTLSEKRTVKKDVSIPEEMGKVYTSIQDALKLLNVKRFQIDNGTFTLVNNIDTSQLPLTVSNIHFHIDNLLVQTGELTGNENILFSDNVVLRSQNQDILFPDGRHRLSFRNFRINLKNKLVEFDSCTIAATKGDSTASSFNVFFDALSLTNIDFDTLYRSEVIKADSVYCVNPKFNLEVEVGKNKESAQSPPKLENIIKQLTGDLLLGHVVVSNADFNIKTIKNKVPSSFIFSNNNFEMRGLRVDQDAPKSITVNSFAMAIRNYENFIKDSSYIVKFDSIHFKDDHITLSNFLLNKLDNGKVVNSFSIPQFSLRGLSWDDLVFERTLKAQKATMFHPDLQFTARAKSKNPGRQNIFQSLGVINEYMDLQQLDIVEGTIDLKLRNNLRVQLDNATLSVESQSLLESRKLAGIKNSLTQLKFDKGTIHAGNMTMVLHHILYFGQTGQFGAGSIDVSNKKKNLDINLEDVSIEKMLVEEASGNVFAEGIRWQKGNMKVSALGTKNDEGSSSIVLKDIRGTNTVVHGFFGSKSVSTKLHSISFTELEKKDGTLLLGGLAINGEQLKLKDDHVILSVADYDITDNKKSFLRQILYKADNGSLNAAVSIPSLTVTPHVQPLLNGVIALDAVTVMKPVINLRLAAKNINSEKKNSSMPKIEVSDLKLSQPRISFYQASDSGMLTLDWQGEQNPANFLQVTGLHTDSGSTALHNLAFYLTDFVFTNSTGKTFNTGAGNVSAQIKNIKFEHEIDQPLEWSGTISNFDARDLRLDSFGRVKSNLVMNSGSLKNLNISSTALLNLQKLAAANTAFQLSQLTGNYTNATTNLHWFNAGFNRSSNTFTLDSFSIIPALSRDSFMARQTHQVDYVTMRSGAVSIGPVDIDTYIKEKKLNIGKATLDKFLFTDYKDKQLPFPTGITKPLPVTLIRRIPSKLAIDTLQLTNTHIEYTEVSEKTRQPAMIPISRMTARFVNIKNYDPKQSDSLDIVATGYLMDTAWIRLQVKESYNDSLNGFVMAVQMKPTDFTVLNPFLIPLASVKIQSGLLDTLSLEATGTELYATGDIQLFYHDLKVRLLKNSDETRNPFFLGLMNFIVNSFIIKKNNKSRTADVFFIRDKNKSAINYLIKIALNGMISGVGAKNNRKELRRYKKDQLKNL